MGLRARLTVAIVLSCAACGSSEDDGGEDIQAGGDAGGGNTPDAALPDGGPAPTYDAGPTDAGPSDAGGRADASTDAAMAPQLDLEIPVSSVRCGASDCNTLDNVCCGSWTQGVGFGSEETCVARTACYDKFERSGTANRAVTRECDGKEDCSAGQVCCVYADGQPLFDGFFEFDNLIGPGGSTICAEEVDCKFVNTMTFITNGIPLGELECNDDGDCEDRAGTSCQAELADSHSTGAGVSARTHVKVCR